MTTALIHTRFEQLLVKGQQGFTRRRQMGMSAQQAGWYRYCLRHQKTISIKTMMHWLQLAGYSMGHEQAYSAGDMQSFAKFCNAYSNREARQLGYAYLLEKWQAKQVSS